MILYLFDRIVSGTIYITIMIISINITEINIVEKNKTAFVIKLF